MREFTGYMHGINLGGWFSQCDHSVKRYDYFIQKDDFRRIAEWGFDHVRIPVDYELILNEDRSFKEEGFRRIDDCIRWCKDNGLNMVLDLHKTVGFSFDDGEREDGFFVNEGYQQIFYDIWREFAIRYGQEKHLSFELLNEVSDASYCLKWNEIIRKTIETIRKEAPDISIIVGGYHNNSVFAIKDLDDPYDGNIVYNFHCYNPLVFTHQGAYWVNGMDTSFRMSFAHTYAEYRRISEEQTDIGRFDFFPEEDKVIDATYFEELFSEAIRIAEEKNVPLYCGEYGVIDRADPEEILKWYGCIHEIFEKYHIGRAMWSYMEMDFGLVDAHYDPIRKELLELK
jgi:aryl-phospho-beta-D-glucosidase BglC (GH1 family)